MSPVQAMERSYSALRDMLREGRYPPGHRLEANRIANEIGVSMTPVRDALNRLVGEQMVEASSGDGFHVPRLSESDLRDLYEWNSALVVMAVQTARSSPAAQAVLEAMESGSLPEATLACFALLASTAPNQELRNAVACASNRLHPFRIAELTVLEPVLGELEEMMIQAQGQRPAIRRYHLTRMRAVPDILRVRRAQITGL